jgi:EmrB/QacA subfamily drug resistance transporter
LAGDVVAAERSLSGEHRWTALVVVVLSTAIVIIDETIVNVALPSIQASLGASQAEMQWAVDSYLLCFAGCLIPAGVLGDRYGHRRVVIVAMLGFGLFSLLGAFARTPEELIGCRALLGVCGGLVTPQTPALIQRMFTRADRSTAIAVWSSSSGAALALGPIVGGVLMNWFWWGSIFLVNVPVALVSVTGMALAVPSAPKGPARPVDVLGILVSVLGVLALVIGIIESGRIGSILEWYTGGGVVAGLVLLGVFVRRQLRVPHPAVDPALFRDRHFGAAAVAIGLVFFALLGSSFVLSYYFQAVRGFSPFVTGLMLAGTAAGMLAVAPIARWLTKRVGPRPVATAGLLVVALSMATCLLLDRESSIALGVVVLVLQGMGLTISANPSSEVIMDALPDERAGAGSAVNATVRLIGGVLGVAVLGAVLTIGFQTRSDPPPAVTMVAQLNRVATAARLPAEVMAGIQPGPETDKSITTAVEFAAKASADLNRAGAPRQAVDDIVDAYVAGSRQRFVAAMHSVALVAAGVALLGALLAFRRFPTFRQRIDRRM